ncbi:MAG: type I-G CRISPR-associated helicase/endonuclease Cas3g [Myxococcales bacterium]
MRSAEARTSTDHAALDRAICLLGDALRLKVGETPFPWQVELLKRFISGTIESSIDIPTGLGKTAVIAIWLVARSFNPKLPRRLLYVVDRRAVVDQSTEVAVELRGFVEERRDFKAALGLARPLPISTLRGQFVDNREWLEDPAAPAIIIGTVDMIGSRLLFEGYGTSRKMRPYQAGLLGADALAVLDEAHLVPPFAELLRAVAEGSGDFGPRDPDHRLLVPPFRLLSLSATNRRRASPAFGLQPADREHPIVRKRLDAAKRLSFQHLVKGQSLAEALAEEAWKLSENGGRPIRCLIFSDARETAKGAKEHLEKLAKGDKKAGRLPVIVDCELFVGARRIRERTGAERRLRTLGFIAGAEAARERPAFLFATSAAEVGIDLDADHMACDLVAWERMVQRLGRVNRRGDGKASVQILIEQGSLKIGKALEKALAKRREDLSEKEKERVAEHERAVARAQAQERALFLLPVLPSAGGEEIRDASPGALETLQASKGDKVERAIEAATTPAPLRPALSRPLVDAWSMTSLHRHPGRPDIEPWLRGWVDEKPQTTVLWRKHLPVHSYGGVVKVPAKSEVQEFFEAAAPHASEQLETETWRAAKWLRERAQAARKQSTEGATLHEGDIVAFVLSKGGELRRALSLSSLLGDENDERDDLKGPLGEAMLIVDVRLAGLTKDGLLDGKAEEIPVAADGGEPWMDEDPQSGPVVRFRIRSGGEGDGSSRDSAWRSRLKFAGRLSEDGEALGWLYIDKWHADAATEEDRSVSRPQLLREHQDWAEERARALATSLGLPQEYTDTLGLAARLHDEGKQAKRWQQAFNAPADGIYAKTTGPINQALLDGYRHELGSLPYAEKNEQFRGLPGDLRDLALHLIAAHHGFARPIIGTEGCEAPPSALQERSREIALRFSRLQERWGPWGLAWWEALLRAADQQASRDNDLAGTAPADERAG